ncbi:hypothetical protein, partial [Micromonospora sp. NPDC003776]
MPRPRRWTARWGGLPLRVRLVAGFAAAMLVVLTGAGAFVYLRVRYALDLRRRLSRVALVLNPTTMSRATAAATISIRYGD